MQQYLRRSPPLLPLLASLWLLGCGSDEGDESPPASNAQAGKGGSSSGGSGGSSAGQAGSSNAGTSGQAGSSGAAQAGAGGSDAGAGGSGGDAGAGGSDAGQGGSSGTSGQAGSAQGGAGPGGAGGSDGGAGGSDAGAGGSDAGAGQGGGSGASGQGGGTSCPTGNLCDGGICAGGACCKASLACNDACCQQGQLCSFGACVNPGKGCFDSSDCAGNEYCERGGSEPGSGGQGGQCSGGSGAAGVCLPLPPICAEGESGVGPNGQITCLQKCEVKPSPKPFEVELKYAWGEETSSPFSTDVMMTPIVIQLDDDDCDGKVTERDIPEIVFSTFVSGQYNTVGALRAISIVGGKVIDKWTVDTDVHPTKQIAGGNLDGVPGSEVVVCGLNGNVRAIKPDGTQLWSVPTDACFMPSIADLDGDGQPEVITEGGVHDGATGALKATFSPPLGAPFIVSDIDSDGKLDVVTSGKAYRGDGSLIVDTGLAATTSFPNTGDWKGPWAAVADFDLDGKPEVIALDNINHNLVVWRYNASLPSSFEVLRANLDINGSLNPGNCSGWGNTHGGGPLTVGDFNSDGVPDVAFAGGVGYAVLDGKKLLDPSKNGTEVFLWAKPTSDCSSASTGSSLFDFNGDGKAEVLYSDEYRLRIYEGATGNVLFETCNTTATLIENPIVADVDNDGQADIVMPSNAYARICDTPEENGQRKSGIRVFGSKNGDWVRTRRVWNQHAYHVTNINEDGSVPAVELPNWKQPGLNNFRQNKQPGLEFAAPDVVVEVRPDCSTGNTIAMIVRNLGQSVLPPGVVVDLLKGSAPNGQLINEQVTTQALFPAQSEILTAIVDDPEVLEGLKKVYAIATFTSKVEECRTDNNTSPEVFGACAKF